MHNSIQGGATNSLNQKKIQIIKHISQEDRQLLAAHAHNMQVANENKFGALSGGRIIGGVPYDIMIAMEKIDPEIFKDKKKTLAFFEQFPIFKTVEKL